MWGNRGAPERAGTTAGVDRGRAASRRSSGRRAGARATPVGRPRTRRGESVDACRTGRHATGRRHQGRAQEREAIGDHRPRAPVLPDCRHGCRCITATVRQGIGTSLIGEPATYRTTPGAGRTPFRHTDAPTADDARPMPRCELDRERLAGAPDLRAAVEKLSQRAQDPVCRSARKGAKSTAEPS